MAGMPREPETTTVLFACVQNAGRSQIAAALFNRHADPARARAISAGTRPAPAVHPVVAEALREIGIETAGAVPRRLTPELAAGAGWLITMGCGDECPVVPGARVGTGRSRIRRGSRSSACARSATRSSAGCGP